MGHTQRIPRILPANRADTRARSRGRRKRGRGVFGSTSAGRGRVRGVATGSGGGGRRRRLGRYVRGRRQSRGRRLVVVPAAAGDAATPFRAIPREDASLRRAWRSPLQANFEAGAATPAGLIGKSEERKGLSAPLRCRYSSQSSGRRRLSSVIGLICPSTNATLANPPTICPSRIWLKWRGKTCP